MFSVESSGEFSDYFVNTFDDIEAGNGLDNNRVRQTKLDTKGETSSKRVRPHSKKVTVEVRHMAVGPGESKNCGKSAVLAQSEATQTAPHSLMVKQFCSINVADINSDED